MDELLRLYRRPLKDQSDMVDQEPVASFTPTLPEQQNKVSATLAPPHQ